MQPNKKNIPHNILPVAGVTFFLIFLILAAGCIWLGSESRITGTDWTLSGYVQNGSAVTALGGTAVTLAFGDDGNVSGSAGCNLYFATYVVKGTTITLGKAGSTMMYCDIPGVMVQEGAYLTLLNKATTFSLEGNRLSFYDEQGTKILSFTKVVQPEPAPLTGTNWTLDSIHTSDAVSSVITGTTITAVFGDDGSVSGSAGCNRYVARYNLTGTTLLIGTAGSTRTMCGTPGVMEQETTFLDLINTTGNYTIEGNHLVLLDNHGGQILTFSQNS